MSKMTADRNTMKICFGKAEIVSSKIKARIADMEELARYLQSHVLEGGDGELIMQAVRNAINVLNAIVDKVKKDLLEPLDAKIAQMKTLESDQSNITSTNNRLKENASNISSLKR